MFYGLHQTKMPRRQIQASNMRQTAKDRLHSGHQLLMASSSAASVNFTCQLLLLTSFFLLANLMADVVIRWNRDALSIFFHIPIIKPYRWTQISQSVHQFTPQKPPKAISIFTASGFEIISGMQWCRCHNCCYARHGLLPLMIVKAHRPCSRRSLFTAELESLWESFSAHATRVTRD